MLKNQGRICHYLRAVSLFTLICFVTTTIAWGMPALDTEPGIRSSEIRSLTLPDHIVIPPEIGSIRETCYAAGPASPSSGLIVHIEEAHGQPEGQENIARILEYLREYYNLDTVYLEGVWQELEPEALRFFDDSELNRELLQELNRVGLIGGVELFLSAEYGDRGTEPASTGLEPYSVSRAQVPGRVHGVEDLPLYKKNLEQFRAVYAAKPRTDAFLRDQRQKIADDASRTLNPECKTFFREWAFRTEVADQPFSGLDRMAGAAAKYLDLDLTDPYEQYDWPQLVRFFRLQQLEKPGHGVQRTEHGVDETKLREWVSGKGLKPDSCEFINDLKRRAPHSAPRTTSDFRTAVERFYESASPLGFRFEDYPVLAREIGSAILSSELRTPELFEEVERLNDRILEKLAGKPEEKALVERYREYRILKKLFSLELTSEEYQKSVRGAEPGVKPADGSPVRAALNQARAFYETAEAREQALLANMIARMKAMKQPNAVLVTGGYHSTGVTEFLKKAGISCVRVTPRITKPGKPGAYLDAMLLKDRTSSPGPERQFRSSNVRPPSFASGYHLLRQDLGSATADRLLGMLREALHVISSRRKTPVGELIASLRSPALAAHGLTRDPRRPARLKPLEGRAEARLRDEDVKPFLSVAEAQRAVYFVRRPDRFKVTYGYNVVPDTFARSKSVTEHLKRDFPSLSAYIGNPSYYFNAGECLDRLMVSLEGLISSLPKAVRAALNESIGSVERDFIRELFPLFREKFPDVIHDFYHSANRDGDLVPLDYFEADIDGSGEKQVIVRRHGDVVYYRDHPATRAILGPATSRYPDVQFIALENPDFMGRSETPVASAHVALALMQQLRPVVQDFPAVDFGASDGKLGLFFRNSPKVLFVEPVAVKRARLAGNLKRNGWEPNRHQTVEYLGKALDSGEVDPAEWKDAIVVMNISYVFGAYSEGEEMSFLEEVKRLEPAMVITTGLTFALREDIMGPFSEAYSVLAGATSREFAHSDRYIALLMVRDDIAKKYFPKGVRAILQPVKDLSVRSEQREPPAPDRELLLNRRTEPVDDKNRARSSQISELIRQLHSPDRTGKEKAGAVLAGLVREDPEVLLEIHDSFDALAGALKGPHPDSLKFLAGENLRRVPVTPEILEDLRGRAVAAGMSREDFDYFRKIARETDSGVGALLHSMLMLRAGLTGEFMKKNLDRAVLEFGGAEKLKEVICNFRTLYGMPVTSAHLSDLVHLEKIVYISFVPETPERAKVVRDEDPDIEGDVDDDAVSSGDERALLNQEMRFAVPEDMAPLFTGRNIRKDGPFWNLGFYSINRNVLDARVAEFEKMHLKVREKAQAIATSSGLKELERHEFLESVTAFASAFKDLFRGAFRQEKEREFFSRIAAKKEELFRKSRTSAPSSLLSISPEWEHDYEWPESRIRRAQSLNEFVNFLHHYYLSHFGNIVSDPEDQRKTEVLRGLDRKELMRSRFYNVLIDPGLHVVSPMVRYDPAEKTEAVAPVHLTDLTSYNTLSGRNSAALTFLLESLPPALPDYVADGIGTARDRKPVSGVAFPSLVGPYEEALVFNGSLAKLTFKPTRGAHYQVMALSLGPVSNQGNLDALLMPGGNDAGGEALGNILRTTIQPTVAARLNEDAAKEPHSLFALSRRVPVLFYSGLGLVNMDSMLGAYLGMSRDLLKDIPDNLLFEELIRRVRQAEADANAAGKTGMGLRYPRLPLQYIEGEIDKRMRMFRTQSSVGQARDYFNRILAGLGLEPFPEDEIFLNQVSFAQYLVEPIRQGLLEGRLIRGGDGVLGKNPEYSEWKTPVERLLNALSRPVGEQDQSFASAKVLNRLPRHYFSGFKPLALIGRFLAVRVAVELPGQARVFYALMNADQSSFVYVLSAEKKDGTVLAAEIEDQLEVFYPLMTPRFDVSADTAVKEETLRQGLETSSPELTYGCKGSGFSPSLAPRAGKLVTRLPSHAPSHERYVLLRDEISDQDIAMIPKDPGAEDSSIAGILQTSSGLANLTSHTNLSLQSLRVHRVGLPDIDIHRNGEQQPDGFELRRYEKDSAVNIGGYSVRQIREIPDLVRADENTIVLLDETGKVEILGTSRMFRRQFDLLGKAEAGLLTAGDLKQFDLGALSARQRDYLLSEILSSGTIPDDMKKALLAKARVSEGELARYISRSEKELRNWLRSAHGKVTDTTFPQEIVSLFLETKKRMRAYESFVAFANACLGGDRPRFEADQGFVRETGDFKREVMRRWKDLSRKLIAKMESATEKKIVSSDLPALARMLKEAEHFGLTDLPAVRNLRESYEQTSKEKREPFKDVSAVRLNQTFFAAEEVGGKARELGEALILKEADPRAPGFIEDGFVMTRKAFEEAVGPFEPEIRRILEEDIPAGKRYEKIRQLLDGPGKGLRDFPWEAWTGKLVRDRRQARFAVRSAGQEESSGAVLPGTHASVIGVRAENLAAAAQEVIASAWTPRAIGVRKMRGTDMFGGFMSVFVQPMIPAKVSGVLTVNRSTMVLSAGYGLTAGSQEEVGTDLVRMDAPDDFTKIHIGEKRTQKSLDPDGEGLVTEEIPENDGQKAALGNPQLREIYQLARFWQDYFRHPLVIEFAIDASGRIFLTDIKVYAQAWSDMNTGAFEFVMSDGVMIPKDFERILSREFAHPMRSGSPQGTDGSIPVSRPEVRQPIQPTRLDMVVLKGPEEKDARRAFNDALRKLGSIYSYDKDYPGALAELMKVSSSQKLDDPSRRLTGGAVLYIPHAPDSKGQDRRDIFHFRGFIESDGAKNSLKAGTYARLHSVQFEREDGRDISYYRFVPIEDWKKLLEAPGIWELTPRVRTEPGTKQKAPAGQSAPEVITEKIFAGSPYSKWAPWLRAIDIVASLFIIMPVLAAATAVFAPFIGWPVFFTQERPGYKGKLFKIYKFRTMPVSGNRVPTRFGAFLRRTGLDELPQAINILKGEMSIVGPRPLRQQELDIYPSYATVFNTRKPGWCSFHMWQRRFGKGPPTRAELIRALDRNADEVLSWSGKLMVRIIAGTLKVMLGEIFGEFETAQAEGIRGKQEDRFFHRNVGSLIPGFPGGGGRMMAVMDGHGGAGAVNLLRALLVPFFRVLVLWHRGNIESALAGTNRILQILTAWMYSGSTLSLVYVPKDRKTAYVMILGDSPVYIFKDRREPVPLPEHGVAEDPDMRPAPGFEVAAEDGRVFIRNLRTGRSTTTTRGFGDRAFSPTLIRKPEILKIDLTDARESIEILVATDGIHGDDPGGRVERDRRIRDLSLKGRMADDYVVLAGDHKALDNVTVLRWVFEPETGDPRSEKRMAPAEDRGGLPGKRRDGSVLSKNVAGLPLSARRSEKRSPAESQKRILDPNEIGVARAAAYVLRQERVLAIGRAELGRVLDSLVPAAHAMKIRTPGSGTRAAKDLLMDPVKLESGREQVAVIFDAVPAANDPVLQTLVVLIANSKFLFQIIIPGVSKTELGEFSRMLMKMAQKARKAGGRIDLSVDSDEMKIAGFFGRNSEGGLVYDLRGDEGAGLRSLAPSLAKAGRGKRVLSVYNDKGMTLSQRSYGLIASLNTLLENKDLPRGVQPLSAILLLAENIQIAAEAARSLASAA